MATSERDQKILRDLENDLLADDRRSSSSVRRRPGLLLRAPTPLAIGLLLLVVGLRVAGPLGTIIGVAGSLALVAGTWLGITSISRRLNVRRRQNRVDPKR